MSIASRLFALLAGLPPAETHDIAVERDIPAPMPDGATLLADRYYPRAGGKRPTVLVRSPYGRRGLFGAMYGPPFAERGFQVLIQSCRGTFGSGGQLDPFRQERADGLATLQWIRQQDWFSGELATHGASYLGHVQWAIAADAGPELKALAAQVTAPDFRRLTYPGESFALGTTLSWTMLVKTQERSALGAFSAQMTAARKLAPIFNHLPLREADVMATGAPVHFWQDWLEHNSPEDDWWGAQDHWDALPRVAAPAHLLGGWYDIFLPDTVGQYRALREAGQQPHLVIGPWAHNSPGWMGAATREALAWFRAHLLGDRSGLRPAPVRIFVMGAGEWRDYPDWPPPDTRPERWHLHPGGRLAPEPPPASGPDRYRYDPADPTPAVGGTNLGAGSGPKDQRALEARPDVLTYSGAPLERDLEVIGPVEAELFVRSSLQRTDFCACLCDVAPSGRSTNLCDALVRTWPGHPAPEADGCLRLRIELWPTAYRFRRGHRVRLQVSSGAHPRLARNPGSGEPLGTATTLRAAEQRVFHDPAHPSAIILPVMPA